MEETAKIDKLDHQGRGVARIQGKATFITGALPDEVIEFRLTQNKPRFSEGVATRIVEASPQRVAPPCPVYETCGGCTLQHLNPEGQLAFKQQTWLEQLSRTAHITPEKVLTPLSGEDTHYRARARLAVNNKGELGFHSQASNQVVNIDHCLILPEHVNSKLDTIRTCIQDFPTSVSEVSIHVGEQVTAIGFFVDKPLSDAVMLNTSKKLNTDDEIWELWQKIGHGEHQAFKASALTYTLPEFNLTIPFTPDDFTQVNHTLNQQMVMRAIELMAIQSGDEVIDFFCGLGNFSLPLAKSGAKVLALEGEQSMVRRLNNHAQSLGLTDNLTVEHADLFSVSTKQLKAWGKRKKWLIDPPRAGAKELIEGIDPHNRPRRIVYVSCNPATLARDAKTLTEKGYTLTKGGVINMFPHTAHIESINVFER